MPQRSTKSYQSGDMDAPLLDVTIGQYFDEVVNRFPEREAMMCGIKI